MTLLPEALRGFPVQNAFPTVLIVLDVAAAVVYWHTGGLAEWRKIVYWGAAAALTYTVTW
jgi:hypothetical protein